jgi:hypothetical protein
MIDMMSSSLTESYPWNAHLIKLHAFLASGARNTLISDLVMCLYAERTHLWMKMCVGKGQRWKTLELSRVGGKKLSNSIERWSRACWFCAHKYCVLCRSPSVHLLFSYSHLPQIGCSSHAASCLAPSPRRVRQCLCTHFLYFSQSRWGFLLMYWPSCGLCLFCDLWWKPERGSVGNGLLWVQIGGRSDGLLDGVQEICREIVRAHCIQYFSMNNKYFLHNLLIGK